MSIPAEIIYFDDINPSIHDDASSCFGNRWNMNILATRSGPTGRLNVEHITIINFTTIGSHLMEILVPALCNLINLFSTKETPLRTHLLQILTA